MDSKEFIFLQYKRKHHINYNMKVSIYHSIDFNELPFIFGCSSSLFLESLRTMHTDFRLDVFSQVIGGYQLSSFQAQLKEW